MPRRDGTGPLGQGAMTGRGMGLCSGINNYGSGLGIGRACGRGMGVGRGFGFNQVETRTQKELLEDQRDALKSRLKLIDEELDNL